MQLPPQGPRRREPSLLLTARHSQNSSLTKHRFGVRISTLNSGSFYCHLNPVGVVYSRSTCNLQPAPLLLEATDAHGLVEKEAVRVCVYIEELSRAVDDYGNTYATLLFKVEFNSSVCSLGNSFVLKNHSRRFKHKASSEQPPSADQFPLYSVA